MILTSFLIIYGQKFAHICNGNAACCVWLSWPGVMGENGNDLLVRRVRENNPRHQLSPTRGWIARTSAFLPPPLSDWDQTDAAALWQLCFAMGNMLSHLGASQPRRCEGGDDASQKRAKGSPWRAFNRCWHAHVTDPRTSGDAPSGWQRDKRGELHRSHLHTPPLINLQSDCPQDSLVLIRGGNMSTMHALMLTRARLFGGWQKRYLKVWEWKACLLLCWPQQVDSFSHRQPSSRFLISPRWIKRWAFCLSVTQTAKTSLFHLSAT